MEATTWHRTQGAESLKNKALGSIIGQNEYSKVFLKVISGLNSQNKNLGFILGLYESNQQLQGIDNVADDVGLYIPMLLKNGINVNQNKKPAMI